MPDQTDPGWTTVDLRGPRTPEVQRAMNQLYERAEDAAAVGLPLSHALQVVRDGYSSVEADQIGRDI